MPATGMAATTKATLVRAYLDAFSCTIGSRRISVSRFQGLFAYRSWTGETLTNPTIAWKRPGMTRWRVVRVSERSGCSLVRFTSHRLPSTTSLSFRFHNEIAVIDFR